MKKEITFFFKQVLFALLVVCLFCVLSFVWAILTHKFFGISPQINIKVDQMIAVLVLGIYIKRFLNSHPYKKKFDPSNLGLQVNTQKEVA